MFKFEQLHVHFLWESFPETPTFKAFLGKVNALETVLVTDGMMFIFPIMIVSGIPTFLSAHISKGRMRVCRSIE